MQDHGIFTLVASLHYSQWPPITNENFMMHTGDYCVDGVVMVRDVQVYVLTLQKLLLCCCDMQKIMSQSYWH
jgi:hypothetical protein